MSRNLERTVTGVIALVLVALFFVMGRGGANDVIDNAQATAASLQNTVNELLGAPDLSDELAQAEAELAAAQTEVALLLDATSEVKIITATTVPATSTPEFCYPSDLDEVVVIRDPRLNLWASIGDNAKGRMIMDIFEDDDGNRVQYSVGVTFFVYEEAIVTDGMNVFYEVFGPHGKGLFVKETHIKLFEAEPDLLYCSS